MSAQELVILIACLLASWFFSGIETGVISMNKLRLHHLVRRKVPGADILQDFAHNPDLLIGTTLTGNTIVNTVASVIVVSVGTRNYGEAGSWVASAILTLLMLVFCEYFPKTWFQSFPTRRCLPYAPLLKVVSQLFSPLSWVLMKAVTAMIPGNPGQEPGSQPFITREELMHLARESEQGGALTPDERRMIHSVIELKTITCGELMIPRNLMVYVHNNTTVDDLLNLARFKEVNRFPVYQRESDQFVGIVNIFDVLADEVRANKTAQDYMRPPQLVAKITPVDHVLPRMRVTRQPMVLVADEANKVVGLITLEDVLQEVVGNL